MMWKNLEVENNCDLDKVTCEISKKSYDINDPFILKFEYQNDYHYYLTGNKRYGYVHCSEIKKFADFDLFDIYYDIDDDGNLSDLKFIKIKNGLSETTLKIKDSDSDKKIKFVNIDILRNNKKRELFYDNYIENFNDNIFYHKSLNVNNDNYVCSAKTKGENFISLFNTFNKRNIPLTYHYTLGKKYTFGFEVETISGYVPQYLTNYIDFSSVHDGSLRHKDDNEPYGKEYVTGVLAGDQGLLHLKMMLNEINKRCLINQQCGNHIHIAGISFNKVNIIYLYYLFLNIQNELSLLLTLDRVDGKYTKFLPTLDLNIMKIVSENVSLYDINLAYNNIFKFVSSGYSCDYKWNRSKEHPLGRKCNFNLKSARYCWVNFVPTLCNTRENGIYTLEFRMPEGSLDYHNNKMWLLLCMGLVDYVENHKQDYINVIKNYNIISLEHIINVVYGSKGSDIIHFINSRKEKRVELDYTKKVKILKTIKIKDL